MTSSVAGLADSQVLGKTVKPERRLIDLVSNPSGANVIGLFIFIFVARFIVGAGFLAIDAARVDLRPLAPILLVAIAVSNWATVLIWLYATLRYVTGHRAPWSRGFMNGALGRRASNPSVGDLFLFWIIGVCTVVGYALAIYATWRFLDGHRASTPSVPTAGTLADRLSQLEAARQSGLVTEEQYSAAKQSVLESI